MPFFRAFFLAALALTAAMLHAQSFDPKMPASVPAVTGAVVENLTMHYIDIAAGSGAAAVPGKQYTVHYTGWLRDGTKFDSSIGKEPLKFVQGRRQLIGGWEVGFEGMKVGGKRRLFIPYQLAYGEAGRGSIPPKAELIFDVELLAVSDVPDVPAAADILLSFSDSEAKVMALAKAVPEEKYAWRPAPGVRSFGEVFVHIASANQLLMKLAASTLSREELGKAIEDQAKLEKQPVSKERVLQMLTESFAAARKTLQSERPATLARDADFFGTATTRRGIYVSLDVHIGEHLGQAIAYARMNGITPPWSAGGN
jgi:uncharacterized damage-inducible protein DinB